VGRELDDAGDEVTDQAVQIITAVLIAHTRIRPPAGDCSCGHVVPLGHSFTAHQAERIVAALEANGGRP
jgi:hypothetical protein